MNTTSLQPLAVSKRDACRLLNISKSSLWRLTATGRIKTLTYRTIAVSEIERYIARQSR